MEITQEIPESLEATMFRQAQECQDIVKDLLSKATTLYNTVVKVKQEAVNASLTKESNQ